MTDAIIARLRTLVPVAWGALITWLLSVLPWLPGALDWLGVDPNSVAVQAFVTGVVIAAFYELVHRAQPWLNAHAPWLARILAGSTALPTYSVLTAPEAGADAAASGNDHRLAPYVGGAHDDPRHQA